MQTVYALVNRETGFVFYVGRTRRNPKCRAREWRHFYRGCVDVRLKVLEEVAPGENHTEHEWWWIRELLREGEPLVNIRLRGRLPRPIPVARAAVRSGDEGSPQLLAARQAVAAELRDLGILD